MNNIHIKLIHFNIIHGNQSTDRVRVIYVQGVIYIKGVIEAHRSIVWYISRQTKINNTSLASSVNEANTTSGNCSWRKISAGRGLIPHSPEPKSLGSSS